MVRPPGSRRGRNTRRSYIKNNITAQAIVVVEVAIKKRFTSANRALEEEVGGL